MSDRIELRPATPDDLDLLDEMHTIAMRPHVERVYPWKPALFRETFDPTIIRVIMIDGAPAGMLKVTEESAVILLRTILLLPAYRRRGIGGALIGKVIAEGTRSGRPVRLQVLRENPARRLYEQLGFRTIEETATHHVMEILP